MKQAKQKNEPPLVGGGQGRSSESITNDAVAVVLTLAIVALILGLLVWNA
jgi:hypothetical protein